MIKERYFIPKKESKKDYHEYTGVPKPWEVIFAQEFEDNGQIEVNKWQSRYH